MSIRKKLILGSTVVTIITIVLVGYCSFYAFNVIFASQYGDTHNDKVDGLSLGQLTTQTYSILTLFFIIMLLTIIIFMIIMVSTLIKTVLNPLNSLREMAKAAHRGDFSYEIKYNEDDEVGRIIKEFKDIRLMALEYSKEKLKLENQRKVMIASIAHDLKTPLTSINGYIDGLIEGVANTEEKRERYLKIIKNKTKDLNKLVDDLFLFSKLDLDSVPFNIQKIDYYNFIYMIFKEIDNENVETQITIEKNIDDNIIVAIDESQFKRVLTNIVANSIKYKKTPIVNINISIKQNKNSIITKISDDGKGIEESAVGNIFQRFYRSDEARTNPSGGSGLGLSITKHIVDKLNGNIWAKSKLGEGTSIYISLPIVNKQDKR